MKLRYLFFTLTLLPCFWIFPGVAQENRKAAQKTPQKSKAAAKPKGKGQAQMKESPISLASRIRPLKKEKSQIDLPAAVTLGDGTTMIAYTEWDGVTDTLRLVSAKGEEDGFDSVATVVEGGVLHAPALAVEND